MAMNHTRDTLMRGVFMASVLLLLALLWVVTAYLLNLSRASDLQQAEARLEGRSEVFAQFAQSVFKHLDAELIDLRPQLDASLRLPDAVWRAHQGSLAEYAPQVSAVNESGLVMYSSMGQGGADVSGQEQFRFHKGGGGADRPYVSPMQRSLSSGKWLIHVSRPIIRDGRFAGILQLGLEPEVFTRFAQGLAAREGEVFAIVRTNGEFLARFPNPRPEEPTRRISGSPFQKSGAPLSGSFRRVSPLDGEPRLYAYRTLPGRDMHFVTGISESTVFDEFDERRSRAYQAVGTVTVVMLTLLYALMRELQRNARIQDELTAAVKRAETANHEKGQFLATMSHEIRTPLNGVVGMSQMLLETGLNPRQQDYATSIARSGQALAAVVNDILDLSKIEAGQMTLTSEPFSITECVESVRALFRYASQSKGLALRIEVAPEAAGVFMGDAIRIRQVLINFVGNAIKFTEHGSVTLSVSHSPQGLLFEVRDTGMGIAPESLSRLFSSFGQVDMSSSRRHEGTGLGLAISRQLVEAMKGTVGVDSTVGLGSRFWARIPLMPSTAAPVPVDGPIGWASATAHSMAAVEATPAPVADGTPAGVALATDATAAVVDTAKIRVLLAEDNLVNQKVSVFMLERLGCQVELAINGQLAVEAATRQGYDLILMDMRMPDMDGLEATRAIRAGYGPNKGTPIVAMTANTMAEDRDTCLAAGMNDFLGKPILLDRLKDCLSRWVKVAPTASDRDTEGDTPAIG